MKANGKELWAEVVLAGERAAFAYTALVKAADDLAEGIGWNEDYVLRRVLPMNADERRDSERIVAWLEKERDEIESRLAAREAAREAAARREALLARLALSAEDKKLLGIDERTR
jgi:hypothetical protein